MELLKMCVSNTIGKQSKCRQDNHMKPIRECIHLYSNSRPRWRKQPTEQRIQEQQCQLMVRGWVGSGVACGRGKNILELKTNYSYHIPKICIMKSVYIILKLIVQCSNFSVPANDPPKISLFIMFSFLDSLKK